MHWPGRPSGNRHPREITSMDDSSCIDLVIFNQLLSLDESSEREFCFSIYKDFFKQIEAANSKLEELAATEQFSQLIKDSHFLLSSSAVVGCTQLCSILGEIHSLSRSQCPSIESKGRILLLCKSLPSAIAESKKALQGLLSRLGRTL